MKTIVGLLIAIAVSAVTSSAHAALIISQYYEGTNNDKYIEISNTGPSSVDLSASSVRLGVWNNANREGWKTSTTPSAFITLSGTILPNATYLLSNTGATTPAYAVSGSNLSNNTVIVFSSDDSVVLYSGTTYAFANVIDAFGVAGTNTYLDTSYVRNATVTSGTNADFNPADWTQFSLAAVASASPTSNERLGFHAIPEPSTFALAGFALIGLGTVVRRRRSV